MAVGTNRLLPRPPALDVLHFTSPARMLSDAVHLSLLNFRMGRCWHETSFMPFTRLQILQKKRHGQVCNTLTLTINIGISMHNYIMSHQMQYTCITPAKVQGCLISSVHVHTM